MWTRYDVMQVSRVGSKMGPHFLRLDVALDFQGLPLRGWRAVEAATLPKDPLCP